MTQVQIRKKKDALLLKIKKHQNEIEHVRVDLRALEGQCAHPNLKTWMAMGRDSSAECPDCGYGY